MASVKTGGQIYFQEDNTMKETFVCEICGNEYPSTERTVFDGLESCPRCLEERTVVCADCGRRIWNDDNEGSNEHPLCERCYDRNYTRCSNCGTIIRENYQDGKIPDKTS